jgi:hypothetical protein
MLPVCHARHAFSLHVLFVLPTCPTDCVSCCPLVSMSPFCIQLLYSMSVCLASLMPFPSAFVSCLLNYACLPPCPVCRYILSACVSCLFVFCVLISCLTGCFCFMSCMPECPPHLSIVTFCALPCCVSRCHRPLYLVYRTT